MGEGDELGSTATSDAGSLTPSQELGSLGSVLVALARTEAPALAPGTLIAEQYRIVRPIGDGGMGVVWLAHDLRLDRDVAVKSALGSRARPCSGCSVRRRRSPSSRTPTWWWCSRRASSTGASSS